MAVLPRRALGGPLGLLLAASVVALAGASDCPPVTLATSWTIETDWQFPRPVLDPDGDIFVMAEFGVVSRLAAADGSLIGTLTPGPERGIRRLVIDGDMILAGTGDNNVTAWSIATGELLWSTYVGNGGMPAPEVDGTLCGGRVMHGVAGPVVAADRVYFGSSDGKAYCLDRATGELIWEQEVGAGVYSVPILRDSALYVSPAAESLAVLDPESGEVMSLLYAGTKVSSSRRAMQGDLMFLTGREGSPTEPQRAIVAVDTRSSEIAWSYRAPWHRADLAVGPQILCVAGDTELVAMEPGTGRVMWRAAGNYVTPSVVGDYVLAPIRPWGLVVLCARSGEVVGRIDLPGRVWTARPIAGPGYVLAIARNDSAGLISRVETGATVHSPDDDEVEAERAAPN